MGQCQRLDGTADRFRHVDGPGGIGPGEDDAELLPTRAGDQVRGATIVAQHPGHGAQAFVSLRVPEMVVVLLEVIHVQAEERELGPLAAGAAPLLVEPIVEGPSVREAGQPVFAGLPA